MKDRVVRVKFTGLVSLRVPDHLSDADADLLAEKIALAKILATCENPDAPEEDACDEFLAESAHGQESDWDAVKVDGIGGEWTSAGVFRNIL